jgi:Temperature dependent protein affecting M2 dsRNA replication/XPG I-region
LGIDAEYFVTRALTTTNKREPLVNAIGGYPCSLETAVDSFVSGLKPFNITPLFVFKGLDLVSQDKPFSRPDAKPARREYAWSLYDKGQGEQAVMAFDDDVFHLKSSAHGTRMLINHLINKNIDYIVAPYTASAQLAYLNAGPDEYIDAIYGSSDVLVYQVDRVITSIDLTGGTFQWVNKKAVLSELGFTNDQFLEAAIACGCELSPVTFPPIDQMAVAQPLVAGIQLKISQDLVQTQSSIYAAVMTFPNPENSTSISYPERFRKAVSCALFQPVWKASGRAEPIENNEVPNDIHEFIGQRLPDELFFYLSKGLIGPELLDAITSGLYIIEPPLEGGNSREYYNFMLSLQTLRSRSISYLSQILHRYYQFKVAKAIFWSDPGREIPMDKITPPLYVQIGSSWKLTKSLVDLSSVSSPGEKVAKLLSLLETPDFAKTSLEKPEGPRTSSVIFATNDQLLSNVFFRFFQTVDFISTGHTATPWGSVLVEAIKANPGLAEELIISLSLIKSGYLTARQFEPAYSGGPLRGTAEERKHILLISRLATHISLDHNPIGFTGPLSRSLLSFQSIMAEQIKAYRVLVEAILVSSLANGESDRLEKSDSDWASLVKSLPFTNVPSAGTAIAVKSYLEELVLAESNGDAVNDTTKTQAKESLKSIFKQAANVSRDIERAFNLWDAVYEATKSASAKGLLTGSVKDDFVSAHIWLTKFR